MRRAITLGRHQMAQPGTIVRAVQATRERVRALRELDPEHPELSDELLRLAHLEAQARRALGAEEGVT